MTKSELVETLDNLIIESFKQRESVDFDRFPEKYGVYDGKGVKSSPINWLGIFCSISIFRMIWRCLTLTILLKKLTATR